MSGRRVGPHVEISLSRGTRRRHRFRLASYTPVELLAIKRFAHLDSAGYVAYASRLEDAARCAARGELGYCINSVAEGGRVRVSVVARLLTEDGRLETKISHEHWFDDPDSHATLVQTNEKATELRAMAQQLNEEWTAAWKSQLLELQAQYEQADAQAASASDLQRIVEAEAD